MAASNEPPNPGLEKIKFEMEKLSKIPSSIGSFKIPNDDDSIILFEIKTSPKLILKEPASFKVILPSNWPAKPPTVILLTSEVPMNVKCNGMFIGQPVKTTILDEMDGWSRTYNLSIIFYTLRDMFKIESSSGSSSPSSSSSSSTTSQQQWDIHSTPWLPDLPQDIPSGKLYGFIAGHAGGQGRRRTMEDAVVIQQKINLIKKYTSTSSIFAIFDGHAGDTCVKFVEENLPNILINELNSNDIDFREAIGRTFLKTDNLFLADSCISHTRSGCTACLVMFDGQDKLYAGNLGDCRAVLCREKGEAQELTFDCRADRPDEIARIIDSGGFVNNKRVNGQLAVSRALGDYDYKVPKRLVSPSPELTEIRLRTNDEFLLIACDGLWDVLSSEEAIRFVRDRINATGGDAITATRLSEISDQLVKHAIDDKKSTDNVSVLIAKIVPPEMDGGGIGGLPDTRPTTPIKAIGITANDDDDIDDDDFDTPIKKKNNPVTTPAIKPTTASKDINSPDFDFDDFDVPSKAATQTEKVKKDDAKGKGASIDTDEGLMEFLLDDENFKD
jgi:serine/threonine protein phosphatase PrpC/ubiquitin-protein ligase